MVYDVIGVGMPTVDHLGEVDGYPGPDSKTPLLDFSKQGGGPVPTALVTLARLGARVVPLQRDRR